MILGYSWWLVAITIATSCLVIGFLTSFGVTLGHWCAIKVWHRFWGENSWRHRLRQQLRERRDEAIERLDFAEWRQEMSDTTWTLRPPRDDG